MKPFDSQSSSSMTGNGESVQRIAVIDDEHRWLKVFKRMFRNSDYIIETYDDPKEFVRTIAIQPHRYAGIICDIKMPQMNGHEVYQSVKTCKETSNIPFLIVSGVLTQDHNLSKVQGIAYVSKLDDDLRGKVFEELIEVIEHWPKIRHYLRAQDVPEDKIDFLCQFFMNYNKYFNEILTYVNQMETACVNGDTASISRINDQCNRYMDELQDTCTELIALVQECPDTGKFIAKVCERGRTSLNMLQTFQLLLTEEHSSNAEFKSFLLDCRDNLEKIIVGTEKGYNLRDTN